jgi:hypothetical protein
VLIDSRQKTWMIVTGLLAVAALGVYEWLKIYIPDEIRGSSTAGLWFGTAGAALMIFAGSLSFLRRVPSWWWLGSRKFWMAGHIWLGLLSAVLILCHSSFHWGGLLEQVLWVVFGLTLATGILGLILQQFLPRLMTSRLACEAPYEQIPHMVAALRAEADVLQQKVRGLDFTSDGTMTNIDDSQRGTGAQISFLEFYSKQVRPFLTAEYLRSSPMANALEAESRFSYWRGLPVFASVKEDLTAMEELCAERRRLAQQQYYHHWLHAWMVIHIVLSLLLLVLGLAHVVTALYF